MKKITKSLLLAAIAMLWISSIQAQNTITVSHQGVPSFFAITDAAAAITAAQNGDTLYLPGGTITPWAITINKELHIYGTGIYPDSTTATQPTNLGDLYFVSGADGSSIQGCTINTLQIGTSPDDQSLTNFSISRCKIYYLYLGVSTVKNINNVIVSENMLTRFTCPGTYNAIFSKNVFNYFNDNCQSQSIFFINNIFYSPELHGVVNCYFINNIFVNNWYGIVISANLSTFQNTLVCSTNGPDHAVVSTWGINVITDSIINQGTDNTFENANTDNFSFDKNYHLKATSPGKNYGTDGTDVGIYGTANPYKEGGVPSNPHIVAKEINAVLDETGKLNVNITVTSQNR